MNRNRLIGEPEMSMEKRKAAGELKKTYEPHEVDHAMDTLMKAEEIKKNPHLMKHVQKKAGSHQQAIKSIQDLRNASKKMDTEPDEDDMA